MLDFIMKYWIQFCFGLIGTALATLGKMIHGQRIKYQNIGDGVEALLRDRIIQAYDSCVVQGFCSVTSKENISRMYSAYHALGGNDVITELKDKILVMPEYPPEQQVHD